MNVLILYYSQTGSTKAMAHHIARGASSIPETEALLRTVPSVSTNCESTESTIPKEGDIYCAPEDLEHCDALILGSPTRFGNMAAPLKYFLDSTSAQWLNGTLINKPAAVFTSSASMHGGQESTLLSMMLPLLHHGMYMVGVPYSEAALHKTRTGGTPYGASHVNTEEHSSKNDVQLSKEETQICHTLGARVAKLAKLLKLDR